MSYCNNKEYDARRMKDHEAEDRAGDTKQSREDWIASVIAERDLYKGECALLSALVLRSVARERALNAAIQCGKEASQDERTPRQARDGTDI